MIITIDGPSGTGKTTVARKCAERLGFAYFDTGAMYRSITWLFLQKNCNLSHPNEVKELLDDFQFSIRETNGEKSYFVGETEVSQAIRSQKITSYVSTISALRPVRELVWKLQREAAKRGHAVFEGRDMGTVVFPQAEVKIFLSATPEVRARRRMQDSSFKEKELSHEELLATINHRDKLDSTRELAPLRQAEDAVFIDTSDLSIEQVVDKIVKIAQAKSA